MDEQSTIKVIELIETKPFDALSIEEKRWVLEYISEDDYKLRYQIVQEARRMEESELVAPLVLPRRNSFVPLFLVGISSAAAAAIFVFFAFRTQDLTELSVNWRIPTAQADTVYIQQTRTDTLIDYVYVAAEPIAVVRSESTQLPEYQVSPVSSNPIRSEDIVNEGVTSLSDTEEQRFRPQHFIGM